MICEECSTITKRNLKIETLKQNAYLLSDGKEIKLNLTPYEFKILNFLARHEGQAFSRADIKSAIWGDDVYMTLRTLDAHISRARTKIRASRCQIKSAWSIGYYFTVR